MTVAYEWRGAFTNDEVNALHAQGFGYPAGTHDWVSRVQRHSLGWVCARTLDGALAGFVNVIGDGALHAFLLDTLVESRYQRAGVGTGLVAVAVTHARASGCIWLHVDFDEQLRPFYLDACGFTPTPAGLIAL